MSKGFINKIFNLFAVFSVIFNLVLPLVSAQYVFAQEATPSSTLTQTEPTPTVSLPQATPTISPVPEDQIIPTVTPSVTLTPRPTAIIETPIPTVTPSLAVESSVTPTTVPVPTWQSLSDNTYEINNIVVNEEYAAPQNNKVKIHFNTLPSTSNKLSIKEVRLTTEQVKQVGALSDTAYDITSSMPDGTFTYDLTLPIPPNGQNKDVDVKSSEDIVQISSAQKVNEPEEKTAETITIKGLNHFTIFVVTTPLPDTAQSILVNEVLPNPSTGSEWVELYNNTDNPIDLSSGSGWVIKNNSNSTQSLSGLGSIQGRGRVVFEQPTGWLNNTEPETVTILDQNGVEVDKVVISTVAGGIELAKYPGIDESVGRLPDGSANWILFNSPTKGNANIKPNLKAVSPTNNTDHGYPDWYQDDNGVRVVPCLNGQDPRCALISEPGFNSTLPADFPDNATDTIFNFPSELFYWSAIPEFQDSNLRVTFAVEGAFDTPDGSVAFGQQIIFGRLRIDLRGLQPNSSYLVTHPWGTSTVQTDAQGGGRNDNSDIGCAGVPCNFADALASPIFESFLRWDKDAPAGYLGDGVTPHTVTGSPLGRNLVKIEGAGLGAGVETNLFTVTGKIYTPPVVPPPGCVDTAPDAPVLVSPPDGSTGIVNSPILNWTEIANFGNNCLGNTNQYEIFLDSGNVNPATSWGKVDSTVVSKLILALSSNTTYSWKVRALNGAVFTESPVWTFTTTNVSTSRGVSVNIDPNHNYPLWYRDDSGIQLMPCLLGTDPRCVLPAPGEEPQWVPDQATDFPINFPSEFFYWITESEFMATPGGGRTSVRMALEGAFANENPFPGDQMVFGRIRVTGTGLNPNSTYTVTHPYGVDTYQTDDLGIIRRNVATEDIGCVPSPGVLCDFNLALPSRIFGGFLRHSNAPDGYLGDAISLNSVIGSPTGNNFYKIEGPGLPAGGLQTNLFTVSGKVFVAPTPPPEGCVDSAPNTPGLNSPTNAAVGVSTNPNLSWNALISFGNNCTGNIDRYQILLDEGSVDPTTVKATILSSTLNTTILNLKPNTIYSWKVRASNGVLTTDSEVRTFVTTSTTNNRAVATTLDADNGYPDWYRDDLGVTLAPCLSGADTNCVLPGLNPDGTPEEPNFNPNNPTDFPDSPTATFNFPTEFFYWVADSNKLDVPVSGGKVFIRMALEGAFLNGNVAIGDQMVFGRIRVSGTGLKPNSTYTVTHPYGVDTYETDATGVLKKPTSTEDIGCQAGPCDFTLALGSRVFGGFLKWDSGAPAGYLGDTAIPHIVTGSPENNNFFRIDGPGLAQNGVDSGSLETNLFTISGKLSAAPPAGDNIAPVITILSENPVDIVVGSVYNDAGATASDNIDGNVTANIVTSGLPINTSTVGTFTVTYNVSDTAGNPAVTATRTVNVVTAPDVIPPTDPLDVTSLDHTINIASSNNTINMVWSAAGTPLGANDINSGVGGYSVSFTQVATDIPDTAEDLTASSLGVTSPVLTDGSWFFHLRTVDNAGNWTSTVHVGPYLIDTTAPDVTGLVNDTVLSSSKTWNWNSSDTAAQFRFVIDQFPTSVPVGVYSNIKTATQSTGTGTFYIHVQAKDLAGNESAVVTVSAILAAPTGTGRIIINNRVRPFGADGTFVFTGDVAGAIINNGQLILNNLPAGVYTSTETDPAPDFTLLNVSCNDTNSIANVLTRTVTVNLSAGEIVRCTFTNTQGGFISGMKFEDLNGNGRRNAGERGLAGWTIYLDDNNNGVLDAEEVSMVTDNTGNYQFVNLVPKTYNVREVIQEGWEQTSPRLGRYSVRISAGRQVTGRDFGNVRIFSVLGQGKFTAPNGSATSTPSVISQGKSVLSVVGSGGTSTVTIGNGTTITRTDGENMDINQLFSSVPEPGSLSGLGSGTAVSGALQWGIPGIGLSFNNPITLSIYVGTNLDGQTLNVVRSTTGVSGWTPDGIVLPATCTVKSGICTFRATKASYYVAFQNLSTASNSTQAASGSTAKNEGTLSESTVSSAGVNAGLIEPSGIAKNDSFTENKSISGEQKILGSTGPKSNNTNLNVLGRSVQASILSSMGLWYVQVLVFLIFVTTGLKILASMRFNID